MRHAHPRSFLRSVLHGGTFAALLLPTAFAAFAACGGKTTGAGGVDAGADAHARQNDAKTGDAHPEGGSSVAVEASCAVDAGALQDAEIARGFAIVNTHNCFICHGGALQGNDDGVQSTVEGGLAYPPNLTPDPGTGLGCWTNDQIKNAFLNGYDNQGAPICNPMPHFGHLAGEAGLDDAEATAVVQFLRSIPPLVNNPPSTPSCTLSWDAATATGSDAHEVDAHQTDAPEVDAGHHHHDATAPDGGARDAATEDGHTHDGEAHDSAAHRDAESDAAPRDSAVYGG